MDSALIEMLTSLGTEGLAVIKLYLYLKFGVIFIMMGLITFGIRCAWNYVKDE